MNMIGFHFFGLAATVFLCLRLVNRFVDNLSRRTVFVKYILLAASYLFMTYADWRFALVLALISATVFISVHKGRYGLGIITSLAALAFFKYTNFICASFSRIVGHDYTFMNIILPLGISFYTFSAISYILDVKHGKQEPRSLLDVMVYLSFFPKLTSGPIQKSGDFFRQLDTELEVGWKSFATGIQIFVFGMFKKIVLADRLAIFVDQVYATPKAFGSATVLLAAIAYSLQIYFDFSGYSDMAIGSAKTLGFDLPSNFNLPYLSHNVTELWKRWHISLSSWLQEYLYFSLGGNRKGKARTYMNLIITMLLGGIWHGANWTYVIWGLMHGIALAIHKGWMELTGSPSQRHSWCANAFSISVTFIFTTFCWIFFRTDSLNHALEIIGRIFSFDSGLQQPYLWFFIAAIILIIGSLMAFFHTNKKVEKTRKFNVSSIEGYYPVNDLSTFWGQLAFFVLCGLTLCLAYTGGSPFIYGRY